MNNAIKHSVQVVALMLSVPASLLAEKELWSAEKLWKEYQSIGTLTEKQQEGIVNLVSPSERKEVEELIECAKKIHADSQGILEGLDKVLKAKPKKNSGRESSEREIKSALSLLDGSAQVDLDGIELTSQELLDKLYVLALEAEKEIHGLLLLVPQAKTEEIKKLIERLQKVYEDLQQFIAVLETLGAN